jgi:hypothetical protein
MSDSTSTVISLSQRLAELQKRLVDIESERVAVKNEIEAVQQQIVAAIPPSPGTTYRSRVLWLLRRDTSRDYSPIDLWQMLGYKSEADLKNVRLTVSRLAREGAVQRVGHGRYRIRQTV